MKLKSNNISSKVKQLGILFVALIMIISSGVYAVTIRWDNTNGFTDTDNNNVPILWSNSDYIIFNHSNRIFSKCNLNGTIIYNGLNAGEIIQDTINRSDCHSLHISAGRYWIEKRIVPKSYLTITGDGIYSTRLHLRAGVNDHMFGDTATFSTPKQYLVFQGLYLDGNKGNNTGGSGIYLYPSSYWDVYINFCGIAHFDEYGIYLKDGHGFKMFGGYSESHGNDGAYVASGHGAFFDGVDFKNNDGRGARVDASLRARFIGCQFSGNGDDGVMAGEEVIIIGCEVFDNADFGIYLSNGYNSTIIGNVIKDNLDWGIRVWDNAYDNVFIGNRFYNNTNGNMSRDKGHRTLIDGVGWNVGNPNSAGDWQDHGNFGDIVVDTQSGTVYLNNETSWLALN